MKTNPSIVAVLGLLGSASLQGCGNADPPAAAATTSGAEVVDASAPPGEAIHLDWITDPAAARQTAAAENKSVFLYFTGTEWCVPCIVLDKRLLTTDAFRQWADTRVVPVLLDFPKPTPENPDPGGEHTGVAERYGVYGFPTIVMTDPDGRPFATVNFMTTDMASGDLLLGRMEAGYAIRAARDAAFAKAADAEGLDKARALDEGLAAVGMPTALTFYPDTVDRIIALDPDNAAGLKQRYEQAYADVRADAIVQESYDRIQHQDLDGAVAKLDEALALNPSPGLRQALTAFKGQIRLEQGKADEANRLLNEALALDPDSEVAPQIRALRDQTTPTP